MNGERTGKGLRQVEPSIKEILIGTTSSGISYQLRKIYIPYACAAEMDRASFDGVWNCIFNIK